MNKNALLFLVLAVAILVGLFYGLRGAQQPAAPASVAVATAPVVTAQPVTVEAAKPLLFELVVAKGKLVSGPATLQVREGDDVQLQITSDQADELHMHGYDLHLSLKPGTPATLAFKAEHSGRFDYELHHAHTELGTLEVQPK